ncbi:unnamed protein product [Cuscuta epithymum]|uniref:Reverse transcriptase Ty1/copia-type domain-containing protein n=1 Tax=Cuscuta epithymum TaxID=186058 RepID=A0AAV0DFS5_9ASTE|nr:unnamed protein product [Cuscuta epithymum]
MASAKSPSFHPALALTNIKSFIPITLDLENVEYSSWTELLKITTRAYQVEDHIFPDETDTSTASTSTNPPPEQTPEQVLAAAAAKAESEALWKRLDAMVLQWIYGTISHDLLHTILEPDSTAKAAWDRLADLFLDNKNTRALHLETEFSNTRLESFPNIAAYCKALKTLATKLSNVGSPVNNQRLVLRIVNGLPPAYDSVASLIQQTVPLPPYSQARSMLLLEETRKAQQHNSSPTALVHTGAPVGVPRPDVPPGRPHNRGRGRGTSRGGLNRPSGSPAAPQTANPWQMPPWGYWPPPWSIPPCPYPSTAWPGNHSSRPPSSAAGILGPWPHAVQMATYLHNVLPSSTLSNLSPTHILYHKTPSYDHIQVFGCLCYPHHPTSTIHKLDARSTPCIFLGFPTHHKGYICLNPQTGQITLSRHVTFNETIFPYKSLAEPTPPPTYNFLQNQINPILLSHLQNNNSTPPPHAQPTSSATPTPPTSQFSPPSPPLSTPPIPPGDSPPPIISHHPMVTRSKVGIFKPKHPISLVSQTSIIPSPLPKSPILALRDPNWLSAMQDEFSALIKNRTWELVPRPPNTNIIRCLWLFKHKYRSNGALERHKARLVVNGKSQQIGIDCDETFSPVVKPATIRTVLSVALHHSWPLHQLDVKNAFLHGNLEETVYMHQPPGFRDSNKPHHVCRLLKSLYGLKQAPRAWYHRFSSFLSTIGFCNSVCDPSLFIYHRDHHTAYLLLYVDDIILTTSSDDLRCSIIQTLAAEFSMTDLGPLSYFLGIAVTRHPQGIFLNQAKYAGEILSWASLSDCNPVATPVDTNSKLSATAGPPVEEPTLYRSLAGALQYLTFTRPDISYAVQQICLFMHDPRAPHLHALKRILRYVKGTLRFSLHLRPSPIDSLISYSDADWGGCPDTRRSTSGYCVYLGDNLLSWSSKRQPTLSRSSAEAEYRGVANVVAETCW